MSHNCCATAMMRQTGTPEGSADEVSQDRLALCTVRAGRGHRRVDVAHAEGPESDDPQERRTSRHHDREGLCAMPSGGRCEAGAGPASQATGLFPLSCAGVADHLVYLVYPVYLVVPSQTNQPNEGLWSPC